MDHKVPVASGGATTLENLQTLCADCNRGKATNIVEFPSVTESAVARDDATVGT